MRPRVAVWLAAATASLAVAGPPAAQAQVQEWTSAEHLCTFQARSTISPPMRAGANIAGGQVSYSFTSVGAQCAPVVRDDGQVMPERATVVVSGILSPVACATGPARGYVDVEFEQRPPISLPYTAVWSGGTVTFAVVTPELGVLEVTMQTVPVSGDCVTADVSQMIAVGTLAFDPGGFVPQWLPPPQR
ncbi:MAG TPA: hypothetical protein VHF89_02030 [Solirubrobacteraceae bacterium]|nr:hypothetical protein [Solirubrobacteraceae bacterium]